MTEAEAPRSPEHRQQILGNIEKYGCHLILIEPDDYLPGFAYTIGLFQKFKHPEIICFGLKMDVLGVVLNHACDLIKNGQQLLANSYPGFLEGYDIQFVPVNQSFYPNYFGVANWFYNNSHNYPAIQLV